MFSNQQEGLAKTLPARQNPLSLSMPKFLFLAENEHGKKSSGVVTAESAEKAKESLIAAQLRVLKIEETSEEPDPKGALFAFDFKGKKKDGREIRGRIDAPDAVTAEVRLREEFQLNEVTILGEEEIFNKSAGHEEDTAEFLLRHLQAKSQRRLPAGLRIFLLDAESFLRWLFLIYAGYFLFSGLALRFPLGLPADLAAVTRSSPLFLKLLAALAALTIALEIPRALRVWRWRVTLGRSFYLAAFLFLAPLAAVESWLLWRSADGILPEAAGRWVSLLGWPITALIGIFLGGLLTIRQEEEMRA